MNSTFKIVTEKVSSKTKKIPNLTKPIRLSAQTKSALDALATKVNSGKKGKRVKYDDIIRYLTAQTSNADVEAMKQKFTSNIDRFEQAYREYRSKNPKTSKEDFLGTLLDFRLETPETTQMDNATCTSTQRKGD